MYSTNYKLNDTAVWMGAVDSHHVTLERKVHGRGHGANERSRWKNDFQTKRVQEPKILSNQNKFVCFIRYYQSIYHYSFSDKINYSIDSTLYYRFFDSFRGHDFLHKDLY